MKINEETRNAFREAMLADPSSYASIKQVAATLNLLSGIMIDKRINPADTDKVREVAAVFTEM